MRRSLAVLLVAAAALFGPVTPASAIATGTVLYGLTTDDTIVTIDTDNPFFAHDEVDVTGLDAGERLIGIDRRPINGVVYGVSTNAKLYTVDVSTGGTGFVASLVGAVGTTNAGQPIVLNGDEFGFDFNPVPDALRIVSDTGQNLRVLPSARGANAAGATFTDGTLNYSGTTATGVAAAAYTNSAVNPTPPGSTTLYDIDARRDRLVRQDPPNAGTLVDIGSLRFPTSTVTGFDIVGSGGTAYASLSLGSGFSLSFLATIDLGTGRATVSSIAAFPNALRGLTG